MGCRTCGDPNARNPICKTTSDRSTAACHPPAAKRPQRAQHAKSGAERAKTLRKNSLNTEADIEKAMADLHQAQANVQINEGTLKKAKVDLHVSRVPGRKG